MSFPPVLFRRVCLSSLCLISVGPAMAADDGESVIARFTAGLTGVDGHFEQRVWDADGQLKESSSGRVALAVPRQFRWEYQAPFPQLIVADGDHVFIHDPDLEQVTVRKQLGEEQQSPLLAVVDPEERARQFDVRSAGQRDGLEWVELQAKRDDAQLDRALLGFAGEQLVRMELQDSLGQKTEVNFSDWQRNPDFAPDTFHFAIPADADVVGDYDPKAEVIPLGE